MDKKKLLYSAISFSAILFLWPLITAISIPEGNVQEQISVIAGPPWLHVLNFSIALLMGPAMIWMLIRLYPFLSIHLRKFNLVLSVLFYSIYLVLVTVSYGSQVLYFPFLLDKPSDPELMKWFFYNDESVPVFINQTAYLFWSIGSFFYFIPGIIRERGFLQISFLIFIISASLQTLATLDIYIGINSLKGLSFISGILLLPAGILLIIFSSGKKTYPGQGTA